MITNALRGLITLLLAFGGLGFGFWISIVWVLPSSSDRLASQQAMLGGAILFFMLFGAAIFALMAVYGD